jgi:hypothetical protein
MDWFVVKEKWDRKMMIFYELSKSVHPPSCKDYEKKGWRDMDSSLWKSYIRVCTSLHPLLLLISPSFSSIMMIIKWNK